MLFLPRALAPVACLRSLLAKKRRRTDRRLDDPADDRESIVVDMNDESRSRVKYLITVAVDASEKISGNLSAHREILF
jgi:hypothetical protein